MANMEKDNLGLAKTFIQQFSTALDLQKITDMDAFYKILAPLLYAMNQWADMTIISRDGTILYANEEYCKRLKYDQNEIIGLNVRTFHAGFESKHLFGEIWETVKSGRTWRGEMQHKTKDDSIFWTSTIIVPFKDDKGKLKYMIGFHTDITEIKQLESKGKSNFIRTLQNLQYGFFKVRKEQDGSMKYTMSEGRLMVELGGNTERILMKTPFEVFEPDIAELKHTMYIKAFEGEKVNFELELNGKLIYVDLDPIIHNGAVMEVFGTIYDFSEFRDVQKQLKVNEERYQSLIHYSHEYITTINKDGIIVDMNPKTMELIGVKEDMFGKLGLIEATVEEDRPIIAEYFNKAIRGEVQFFEHEVKNNGQRRFLNVTLVPIVVDNEIEGVYSIGKDITEQKLVQEQNAYLAHHDELTGLYNRRWMGKQIQETLKLAKENNQKFAILSLDLDRFKFINDTLGHFVGDELLQQIAERFQQNLHKDIFFVARMGGDEFMILCPNIESEEEVTETAQNILDSLKQPFYVQGFELFVTASIGIVFPSNDTDVTKLMKSVDIALYKAKELGRNMYQVFDRSMNKAHYKSFILERDLRKAIMNDELVAYFQPRVDAKNRKIVGAESLIRWNHPKYGLLPPGQFIPIAEETGLIDSIGDWMMKRVCEQLASWRKEGFSLIPISVNITSKRFIQQDFAESIRELLNRFELEGKWLEIEITENSIMRNEAVVQKTLKELKEMGVRVFIDDFGSGYSSFNYLKTFKIDGVKIDQTFIRNISNHPENASITSAMIKVAQQLNLEVIAEGVETEEELNFLLNENCRYIQGYYFGRPCPIEEFENIYLQKKINMI